MSDELDHEDEAPRRSIPLRLAVGSALRLNRLALDDLSSRSRTSRRKAIGVITGAISDLEAGLRHEAEEATRDLASDLLRALDPMISAAEIEGARTVLELILAALPPRVRLGRHA